MGDKPRKPSATVAFVGEVRGSVVHVTVWMRGFAVGVLTVTLGQWDQLRDDVKSIAKPAHIDAVADSTLAAS